LTREATSSGAANRLTAYGDGRYFREARKRYGPLQLAILPIGAYEPRWFMRDQHMNPAGAVQAFIDSTPNGGSATITAPSSSPTSQSTRHLLRSTKPCSLAEFRQSDSARCGQGKCGNQLLSAQKRTRRWKIGAQRIRLIKKFYFLNQSR
jgi:hypothetical protein